MRALFFLYFLSLFGQSSTYFGPTSPSQNKETRLVKIEIIIQDSPEMGGNKIDSVSFNGQSIPLMPSDIDGNRGRASFQLPPGTYKLKWVLKRDKLYWPRKESQESLVTISPKDTWVQVYIKGDAASIL